MSFLLPASAHEYTRCWLEENLHHLHTLLYTLPQREILGWLAAFTPLTIEYVFARIWYDREVIMRLQRSLMIFLVLSLLASAALIAPAAPAQAATLPLVDDFESGLPAGQDANTIPIESFAE